MIKSKLIKVVSLACIITLVIGTGVITFATAAGLNNESKELDDKIKQTQEDLNAVKNQKSETLKQVEELVIQISGYEKEIDVLEEEIDTLGRKIDEATAKLAEEEANYKKQEEQLNDRLVAVYEAGETSFLDMLLGSSNLMEFISNYYLASEIAKYDTELLEAIEKKRNEIEEAKKALEKSKSEIETARQAKQKVSDSLSTAKKAKDTQVSALSVEEKEKQADLEQFERDKREIQAKLARLAEEEAKKNGGGSVTPSASGYIFPVSGLTKANINNKNYPSYSGHTGVDVNINVTGRTVVAVKSGTVVTSTALRYANGNYRSYGEYIVINHHDGTMTLYAHGLAGSRKVYEGQTVSQGQALMTVGSTGNSTGTHLHFEVLIGGRPVNPLPYLP